MSGDERQGPARRLRDEATATGDLVRGFVDATASVIDREEAAWRRLQQAQRPVRRRRWWWAAPVLLAGAAAVVVVHTLTRDVEPAAPVAVKAPEAVPAPVAAPETPPTPAVLPVTEEVPRIVARREPTTLPHGKVALLDGAQRPIAAVVEVSPEARAQVVRGRGETEIRLGRGTVALDVVPRRADDRLSVLAGPYRFLVVGTVFRVSRSAASVTLAVREGAVEVWRGRTRLALVRDGGEWIAEPRLAAASAPAQGAVEPRLPLAGASAQAGVGPVSAAQPEPPSGSSERPVASPTHDLAAETAVIELARRQEREQKNPAAALRTLRGYQERFPGGTFHDEVALTIVELLPRLGRHAEALTESERLMAGPLGPHRRAELALLRGNLFREMHHDCRRAEREYAVGAVGAGRAADESAFLRAVCLDSLGRRQEAAEAFRAYARRSSAPRARVEEALRQAARLDQR